MCMSIATLGCAAIDARPDYDRAAELITSATGEPEAQPIDDDSIRASTRDAMLKDGLTLDEVVKLALLNNPAMAVEFFEIGIARADLVQSGLFSNPTFGLSVQFPEGGGRSNIQASLAQNIVDLWQIPVKKEIASRNLEAAILRVADRAVQITAQARTAFFIAVGARQALAIAHENVALAQRLLEVAELRKQAGAVGDLDVNLARGGLLDAQIEVLRAALTGAEADADLASVLGIRRSLTDVSLSTPLPVPPEVTLDADAIIALALDSRLDLRAAAMTVDAAERQVVLEIREVIPSFQIGIALERNERRSAPDRNLLGDFSRATLANQEFSMPEFETNAERRAARSAEIDAILGPSLSVTLPIFDQNQAQIARARYTLDQEIRRLESMEISATQAVRKALAAAQANWNIARSFARDVVPQAVRNLDMSRESYRAGRSSLITVLDSQRELLKSRRDYVAALQFAAISVADLEKATAKPISEILTRASESASRTQPADPGPTQKPKRNSP